MSEKRRDSKNRILRTGESQEADGRYKYRYLDANGKRKTVYSWRLVATDSIPAGKKDNAPLREQEKLINRDLDDMIIPDGGGLTVRQLVSKYIATKTGVKHTTRAGYGTVINLLEKDPFGAQRIDKVRLSDAKEWLIRLQQVDKKSFSAIHSIRGVVRPAFQMAVDDDILRKNPFEFQLATVLVNDAVTREAITRKQEKTFLEFIKNDAHYCKYYDGMYILFKTGMRISDADGKISLNQQKPSKHAGLRRFGPEKFLQRNNEFMKERPIFYKKPIKTEKDFSTWLRCFYYTTKAVITEYIYF
ncbi:integrase DNA-binding domain-containing protein [Blautia obeum]|uniref:integrase DNA-binding domain-containing protein n=1 Tax=Blautia obeum TaxID=40520 RepID=UPI003D06EA28